jgi:hypothetical protein
MRNKSRWMNESMLRRNMVVGRQNVPNFDLRKKMTAELPAGGARKLMAAWTPAIIKRRRPVNARENARGHEKEALSECGRDCLRSLKGSAGFSSTKIGENLQNLQRHVEAIERRHYIHAVYHRFARE